MATNGGLTHDGQPQPQPPVTVDEQTERLRVDALASHQRSIGQGDELVQILKNTIAQMESTHKRIQGMSITLFIVGIVVLLGGAIGALLGDDAVWASVIGGVGGIGAIAAVFWTAPLDKVSASINDLVKLEVAFLGYIRAIGEIDSGFQMQYLDILQDKNSGQTLAQAIRDTTTQMRDMMNTTVTLIDDKISSPNAELRESVKALSDRLDALES